jgi:SAM-dependent methyltransferase
VPETTDDHPNELATPDIDDLVARLRERVAARREAGAYPAGLEEEMTAHFRRILHQRRRSQTMPDLDEAIREVRSSLPLEATRIPAVSGLPGGEVFHRTVARLVRRQTEGVLQQVQGFARPVQTALEALAAAVQELNRTIQVDVAQSLDALFEAQAAHDRILAAAQLADRRFPTPGFQPWYSSERFEEAFRGSRDEMLDRYRDLAERLADSGPVLDVGCGRGDFLELLASLGVNATGVDLDGELVKSAVGRGLSVTEDDAFRYLSNVDDQALGAMVLIQVIEHFSPQDVVDFVALAASKVRPGGHVLVETVNPQSLYVFAHALYLDPTHLRPVHPAYLAFLFREAGFTEVEIEWRSPPPAGDMLEAIPAEERGSATSNENVRRLNELLFAPQDYLIAAVR